VPYGTSADEKDVPIVIAENYSIACWSWIALRGPVEIELDEVLRGGGPKGGAAGRRDWGRRKTSLKGGGWRPEPEDGEFVWVIIEVYVGSELRGDRF